MYVCKECSIKTPDSIECPICRGEPEVWKCEECGHELHDDRIENEYVIIKSDSDGSNVSIDDDSHDAEETEQIDNYHYYCSECQHSGNL